MPNPLNDLSVLSTPLALMDLTIVVRGNTRGARSFQQGFNQFCLVLLGVTGADVVFASSIVVQIPDFEEDVQFQAYICAHSIFMMNIACLHGIARDPYMVQYIYSLVEYCEPRYVPSEM